MPSFFSQIFFNKSCSDAKKKRFHETSHFQKGEKAVTTINKKWFRIFCAKSVLKNFLTTRQKLFFKQTENFPKLAKQKFSRIFCKKFPTFFSKIGFETSFERIFGLDDEKLFLPTLVFGTKREKLLRRFNDRCKKVVCSKLVLK